MTEVLFYHLQNMTLDKVLPPLLEKSLARGWRVVVQATTQERIEALDTQIWTYRDESFLPHGLAQAADAADQPILLTTDDSNPNGATVRFLVEGATLPTDAAAYDRMVMMFDGDDDAAVAQARAAWRASKADGFAVTYWQADENGRWQRRGIADTGGS